MSIRFPRPWSHDTSFFELVVHLRLEAIRAYMYRDIVHITYLYFRVLLSGQNLGVGRVSALDRKLSSLIMLHIYLRVFRIYETPSCGKGHTGHGYIQGRAP
jgi:hypothetical protein